MESEARIGKLEGAAMLFFALVVDLLQVAMLAAMPVMFAGSAGWVALIPVVGQAIAAGLALAGFIASFIVDIYFSLIGLVFLGCWFWMRDVPMAVAGRLAAAGLVEFIPILNYAPALTIGTWLSIRAANGKGGLLQTALMMTPAGRAVKAGSVAGAGVLSQRERVVARAAAENRSVSAQEIASLTPGPMLEGEDRSQEALDRGRRVGIDLRDPRP